MNYEIQQFLEQKLISEEEAIILQREQNASSRNIYDLLVETEILDERTIEVIQAEDVNNPEIDLKKISPDYTLMNDAQLVIAKELNFIPILKNKNVLIVAVENVKNIKLLDKIRNTFHKHKVVPCIANKRDIFLALKRIHKHKISSVHQFFTRKDFDDTILEDFLNNVLEEATYKKASDIHFEPYKHLTEVRYRIDGSLTSAHKMHLECWQPLLNYIKITSKLDISKSRTPQDGHFHKLIMKKNVDFRVSICPMLYGENVVIRILDKSVNLTKLKELGYDKNTCTRIEKEINRPGLFIIGGPTGAGKNTTLRVILNLLDRSTQNVMTLENPIEYTIPKTRQKEIAHSKDFAFALKTLLRQAPDVILVGEIRDEETMDTVINASTTGHKIFSTVHGKKISDIFYRMMKLGTNMETIINNLNFLIVQNLIKKECLKCQNHEKECSNCNGSGFAGRKINYETLFVDSELREKILTLENHEQMKYILEKVRTYQK